MASNGDDVALGIDETNRLRASLGLKPLSMEAPQQRVERAAPPPPEKPDPEALRAKLAEAREKRRREQELASTRGLGEAGGDADDVGSWVLKMRASGAAGAKRPRDGEGGGGGERAKRGRGGGGGGGDGEGGDAADLAGARVRHGAEELAEGETMVLTLADVPILDAAGGLNDAADELEEVARAQDKARDKARRAAGKEAKPLWAEDGRVRGLLDKYDEEEEEAGITLDDAGAAAAAAARQDEVRARLAAAAAALGAVAAPEMGGAADYMTAAEAEAAGGGGGGGGLKKKKKKRRLRTTKAGGSDDGGGGLDLDALEAAAAAEGGGDLGSRAAREGRRAAAEAAAAADAAERAARFQRALQKANWASEALRAGDGGGLDDDEAEAELAESLGRARRLAQKNAGGDGGEGAGGGGAAPESMEQIAARLAAKRAEDEAKLAQQIATGGSDFFNAATEFVRNIGGNEDDQAGGGGGGEPAGARAPDAADMDVDAQQQATGEEQGRQQNGGASVVGGGEGGGGGSGAAKARNYRKKGGWVAADDGGGAGGEGGQQHEQQQKRGGADSSVVGDRPMGRGLAGALGLLQDTGALKQARGDWAGRTNEKKAVALIGLEDVYTGGAHEERLARSIEAALTQRDEFGRVMTPKERFRTMCHQFHGIFPSKNKDAHRQRKYLEEVAVKRATTSADASAEVSKVAALTQQLGTPFLPLDGKGAGLLGRGGGGDDDDGPALPVARAGKGGRRALGGSKEPLLGDAKVEAMLGLRKPPPPQPRGGMGPPKAKGGGGGGGK